MISIILPAFNEEKAIGNVIDEIRSALQTPNHEIVVVDDGSTDNTYSIAVSKNVTVYRHVKNTGYGVKFVPIEYHQRMGVSKFRPVRDTDPPLICIV